MLHPSESPARQQQGLNLPEGGREEGRKTERGNIWKWVSLREMVFIFTACSVGAALFQARDNVRYLGLQMELRSLHFYAILFFPQICACVE